jgi:hypothetical protein
MTSTLVSRYGYMEESVHLGWLFLGVRAGSCDGSSNGWSADREAKAARLVNGSGGALSPYLSLDQSRKEQILMQVQDDNSN